MLPSIFAIKKFAFYFWLNLELLFFLHIEKVKYAKILKNLQVHEKGVGQSSKKLDCYAERQAILPLA